MIDGYRIRWEIGTFFLILKEGCKIEEIQLKGVKRIETTLALCMVVAWRINQLMRLGRGRIRRCRRKSRLQNEEWQTTYILNKKTIPKTVPLPSGVCWVRATRKHTGDSP